MPISRPFSTAWLTASRRRLDVDRLLDLARPARLPTSAGAAGALLPLGQRIAVACDAAFAFSYPAQLDAWRNSGAEIDALLASGR